MSASPLRALPSFARALVSVIGLGCVAAASPQSWEASTAFPNAPAGRTGAVGVSGNLTTYYNEIKTGVYDGVIVFASAALPGKLYEVAPYITKIGFGAQYAGGIAANA